MTRYILALPFWALAFTFGMIGAMFEAVARTIDTEHQLP